MIHEEFVFIGGQSHTIVVQDGVPLVPRGIIVSRSPFISFTDQTEYVYVSGQQLQVKVRYIDLNVQMLETQMIVLAETAARGHVNSWLKKAIEALARIPSEDGSITLKEAIEALDSLQRLRT